MHEKSIKLFELLFPSMRMNETFIVSDVFAYNTTEKCWQLEDTSITCKTTKQNSLGEILLCSFRSIMFM